MQTEDFEIEISEVDRQTAEPYANNHKCLIGTALMNKGFNVVSVSANFVRIDTWYNLFYFQNPVGFSLIPRPVKQPYYSPTIVGQKVKFTREEQFGWLNLKPITPCQQEQRLTISTKS